MKLKNLVAAFAAIAIMGTLSLVSLPGTLGLQAARAQGLQLNFEVSDEDVDQATDRLISFLGVRQRDDGSWADITGSHYKRMTGGTTAIAVLALLEADVKQGDKRVDLEKAISALLKVEMTDLYCRSLRIMALSQAYRQVQRQEYEDQIVQDLFWLTKGLPTAGAWHYVGPRRTGDNSTNQYGLLALWEAMWAGFTNDKKIDRAGPTATGPDGKPVNVKQLYPMVVRNVATSWRLVEKTWIERQRSDKGWTYAAVAGPEVNSTLTMTAGAVASLYIIIDEVYAPRMQPGRPAPRTPVFQAAEEGMDWLAERLTPDFTKDGYLAFGILRIASASGHKYIGEHDWFKLGVEEIARRARNARGDLGGSYGPDVQASFYLLFLSRGRIPVTFNKLERPGTDWNVAPRDIANLTRHLVMNFEQRMSWQIVSIDRDVRELLDAPVLFINGIQPLKLTSPQIDKLREYVLRGGFIVGEATTSSATFASSFRETLEKAFPEGQAAGASVFKWTQLPSDHPIFERLSEADLRKIGPVWAMHDGTRTVAILLTRDVATAWQKRDVLNSNEAFVLGWNIFRYASANEALRTRLRPVFVDVAKADTVRKIGVLPAADRWLGDKYAVERLSHHLATTAKLNVEMETGNPAEMDPKQTPMVVLYGSGDYSPADSMVENLKSYISKGGTVLINPNLGDGRFTLSANRLARRLLPDSAAVTISSTDPVMTGMVYRERGKPLTGEVGFRRAAMEARIGKLELTGYRAGERWGVVVTPVDVFLSLPGTPIYGNRGYTGNTAQQIAGNLYLYALEQAEK